MIQLINRMRAQHGLGPLRSSRHLARAADRHSHDMLRHDFFGHPSSDGTPFYRRVRSYANARSVGEDLAMASGSSVAPAVVGMWMNSPPHRAVILSSTFGRIGIGQRSGQLGSQRTTVVTADFASRR